MPNSAPATIEDVARIAEVSIATVSRAIHTPDKVAKTTRQRVNQAIAITGYTTNAMARSLRMGRSNMILILAPDIGDPNFSSTLIGLENEARAHGYGVLIGHTQNDPERGLEYLKFLSSGQATGLVLFTGHEPFGHQVIGQRLPPSVAVFEPVFGSKTSYVGVDDIEGAATDDAALRNDGHVRIGIAEAQHQTQEVEIVDVERAGQGLLIGQQGCAAKVEADRFEHEGAGAERRIDDGKRRDAAAVEVGRAPGRRPPQPVAGCAGCAG